VAPEVVWPVQTRDKSLPPDGISLYQKSHCVSKILLKSTVNFDKGKFMVLMVMVYNFQNSKIP
jgi:hypothetical protein